MQKFKVEAHVRLKSGILDPQGQAISHALHALGFGTIENVRTGKLIEFTIAAGDESTAREQAQKACERLLANPVIEDFEFVIEK